MGWDIIVGVVFGTVLTGISAWALNKVYENVQKNIQISKELSHLRSQYLEINNQVKQISTSFHNIDSRYRDLHSLHDASLKDIKDLKKYTYHLAKLNKKHLADIQEQKGSIINVSEANERYGKVIKILYDDFMKRYKASKG